MRLNQPREADASRYRRDSDGYLDDQREAWEMKNPILIQLLDLNELDHKQQVSFFHTMKMIELPDYIPEPIIEKVFADQTDPIDEYKLLGNRELLALGLCQTALDGPRERRDQVRRKVGQMLRLRRTLS